MKYLAVLNYDCGCKVEPNPGFMKSINFYAQNEAQLTLRIEQLKKRKPRSGEGSQCRKGEPIEILVIDEEFREIEHWRTRLS